MAYFVHFLPIVVDMADSELSSSRYYPFTSEKEEEEEEEEEDEDADHSMRDSYLPPRRLSADRNPNAPRYIKSDSFDDLLA